MSLQDHLSATDFAFQVAREYSDAIIKYVLVEQKTVSIVTSNPKDDYSFRVEMKHLLEFAESQDRTGSQKPIYYDHQKIGSLHLMFMANVPSKDGSRMVGFKVVSDQNKDFGIFAFINQVSFIRTLQRISSNSSLSRLAEMMRKQK